MKMFRINEADNVAVAIEAVAAGTKVTVAGEEIVAVTEVPAGHKMALRDLAEGEAVIKYGCPIGTVKMSVRKGEWLHVHNIKTGLGDLLE